MSEKELLQEINDIYVHLTDQEPTPDEEIEARDQLLEKFEDLKNLNAFPLQIHLIEEIYDRIKNWDTLDLWFKEVEGLTESIGKFLKLTGTERQPIKLGKSEFKGADIEKKLDSDIEDILDISQIVSEVTKKFKGEISTLKDTIEHLKSELEDKEERVKDIAPKKPIQKIVPKKEIKLAPPTIKIPSIKRPEIPPHIKVKNDSIIEEYEAIAKPIEEKSETSEFELEEDISEIPEITEESLLEQIQSAEFLNKPKLNPFVSETPIAEPESEFSFNLSRIPLEEEEIDQQAAKLSPLPLEKPKVMKFSQDKSQLTPLPAEKPKSIKRDMFDATITQEPPKPEKPDLMPIPDEEIIKVQEIEKEETPTFLSPMISKKPKISPISIEEIDTDTIKSSRTDLFDVFSSVARRASEQEVEPHIEAETKVHLKEKVQKAQKSVVSEFIPKKLEPISPIKTEPIESEISFEALPKDKDSLYQELIALEGRRYSLEKSYKDLSGNYGSGIIDEFEFNNRSEGLKNQLDEISSRITKIRRIIASL